MYLAIEVKNFGRESPSFGLAGRQNAQASNATAVAWAEDPKYIAEGRVIVPDWDSLLLRLRSGGISQENLPAASTTQIPGARCSRIAASTGIPPDLGLRRALSVGAGIG